MQKFSSAFLLLFITFGVGYGIIFSTNKKFTTSRDPAAIRQVYDFSHLRGSSLDYAIKERLLQGMQIAKTDSAIDLQLGHFIFQTAEGESVMGCQRFSKVILIFQAEGAAANGIRPTMEAEGPCEYTQNSMNISPLTIPIAKILKEPTGDGEIQYPEEKISLKFSNVTDSWPTKWVLIGVKLSNQDNAKEVSVNSSEVNQILGQPFMIKW